MIDYKYFLYSAIGIGFLMDVFEEGLMSVGIILGWLIGMMTITQWQIQKEKSRQMSISRLEVIMEVEDVLMTQSRRLVCYVKLAWL